MGVEWSKDAGVKKTGGYSCLPEMLEIDAELNGRRDLPDVEELIDSILEYGQLQAVLVRKQAGLPLLVAGFSRWRAITAINKRKLTEKPLEIFFTYTALTEKQSFLANIAENQVRNATTPMDDAYNIQRLINVYQYSESECAAIYKKTLTWIKERLQLLELSAEAEKAVREGRVNTTAAVEISKLKKSEQHKVLQKPGNISKKDVVAPKPKAPTGSDPKLVKMVTDALEDVVDVLGDPEQGKWISLERTALLKIHNYLTGK